MALLSVSSSSGTSFLSGEVRLSSAKPAPPSSLGVNRALPPIAASQANQDGSLAAADVAPSRRAVMSASVMAALAVPLSNLALVAPAAAVVPTTAVAGRVPGLSDPDARGWRTYKRPSGKSGGHGVGWSELTPYSFTVPEGWEEVPVSIADLGGTEIDLRFTSSAQGKISVVVAPVLRFSDSLGNDARIEKVGTPERVINAFGPEVTGQSVEGKVKDMEIVEKNGLKYYEYELDPHILMSTTASGNRLYIMALSANGRQWKKFEPELREILSSFRVG